MMCFFFFSSRRRHTRLQGDWSSDVCSSDLAMGGPQAVLGWFLGALFSVCDGMVYAELGAAMPGAGGAYIYFREAFNPRSWGLLFSFLFLWEMIFVAPLAISAACVGFAEYTHYFFPGLNHLGIGSLAASISVF